MLGYKHVLFTSDFSEKSFLVGKRAQDIAQRHGADLSILHVVEQSLMLYGSGEFALPVDLELESKLEENAKKHIQEQAKQLGLGNAAQWGCSGRSCKTRGKTAVGMHVQKLRGPVTVITPSVLVPARGRGPHHSATPQRVCRL